MGGAASGWRTAPWRGGVVPRVTEVGVGEGCGGGSDVYDDGGGGNGGGGGEGGGEGGGVLRWTPRRAGAAG